MTWDFCPEIPQSSVVLNKSGFPVFAAYTGSEMPIAFLAHRNKEIRVMAASRWWLLLLPGALACGCGGDDGAVKSVAAPVAAASVTTAAAAAPARMPASVSNEPVAAAKTGQAALVQLRALPLLSALAEQEQAALLRQLPSTSRAQRMALIEGYPKLAGLPEQQRELLLNQLEKIIAPAPAGNLLVCECSNEIRRELCVSDSCAATSELAAQCNKACGTLSAFRNQCTASAKCRTK